ncbi:MAG: hypothetical protein RR777_07185 [Christensenellaceae bacterium]
MTYIENIFICLTAPLLVGTLFAGTRYRRSLLLISAGYAVCLLAAYINSFFARLYGADMVTAAVEIAPVVEEVIKLLPFLFYLLIFSYRINCLNNNLNRNKYNGLLGYSGESC